MNHSLSILIAAAFAAVTLTAEHYIPWCRWTGKDLSRPAAYALGTLAINIPLSALLALWGLWTAILAQWVIIAVSGLTVFALYLIDKAQHYESVAEMNKRIAAYGEALAERETVEK